MTYPDDELAGELRGVGNDISLAIDMACETVHDNPELAARAVDGEGKAALHLVDQVRLDYSLTLPTDEELLLKLVKVAVNQVRKEEEA